MAADSTSSSMNCLSSDGQHPHLHKMHKNRSVIATSPAANSVLTSSKTPIKNEVNGLVKESPNNTPEKTSQSHRPVNLTVETSESDLLHSMLNNVLGPSLDFFAIPETSRSKAVGVAPQPSTPVSHREHSHRHSAVKYDHKNGSKVSPPIPALPKGSGEIVSNSLVVEAKRDVIASAPSHTTTAVKHQQKAVKSNATLEEHSLKAEAECACVQSSASPNVASLSLLKTASPAEMQRQVCQFLGFFNNILVWYVQQLTSIDKQQFSKSKTEMLNEMLFGGGGALSPDSSCSEEGEIDSSVDDDKPATPENTSNSSKKQTLSLISQAKPVTKPDTFISPRPLKKVDDILKDVTLPSPLPKLLSPITPLLTTHDLLSIPLGNSSSKPKQYSPVVETKSATPNKSPKQVNTVPSKQRCESLSPANILDQTTPELCQKSSAMTTPSPIPTPIKLSLPSTDEVLPIVSPPLPNFPAPPSLALPPKLDEEWKLSPKEMSAPEAETGSSSTIKRHRNNTSKTSSSSLSIDSSNSSQPSKPPKVRRVVASENSSSLDICTHKSSKSRKEKSREKSKKHKEKEMAKMKDQDKVREKDKVKDAEKPNEKQKEKEKEKVKVKDKETEKEKEEKEKEKEKETDEKNSSKPVISCSSKSSQTCHEQITRASRECGFILESFSQTSWDLRAAFTTHAGVQTSHQKCVDRHAQTDQSGDFIPAGSNAPGQSSGAGSSDSFGPSAPKQARRETACVQPLSISMSHQKPASPATEQSALGSSANASTSQVSSNPQVESLRSKFTIKPKSSTQPGSMSPFDNLESGRLAAKTLGLNIIDWRGTYSEQTLQSERTYFERGRQAKREADQEFPKQRNLDSFCIYLDAMLAFLLQVCAHESMHGGKAEAKRRSQLLTFIDEALSKCAPSARDLSIDPRWDIPLALCHQSKAVLANRLYEMQSRDTLNSAASSVEKQLAIHAQQQQQSPAGSVASNSSQNSSSSSAKPLVSVSKQIDMITQAFRLLEGSRWSFSKADELADKHRSFFDRFSPPLSPRANLLELSSYLDRCITEFRALRNATGPYMPCSSTPNGRPFPQKHTSGVGTSK